MPDLQETSADVDARLGVTRRTARLHLKLVSRLEVSREVTVVCTTVAVASRKRA